MIKFRDKFRNWFAFYNLMLHFNWMYVILNRIFHLLIGWLAGEKVSSFSLYLVCRFRLGWFHRLQTCVTDNFQIVFAAQQHMSDHHTPRSQSSAAASHVQTSRAPSVARTVSQTKSAASGPAPASATGSVGGGSESKSGAASAFAFVKPEITRADPELIDWVKKRVNLPGFTA